MTQGMYYQHSGNFSVAGAVMGLVVGAAVGIPLAFAYSYLILYIPVVGAITFLFSAGFGAAVGIATALGLKSQKVRNVWVALVVTVASGLVAFYSSWAVWIYALLRRANLEVNLLPILLQPGVLWELIRKVNQVGAYNLRGWTPTGTALWILWSLEALIIIGLAVYLGVKAMLSEPFCEACNCWCKESEGVGMVAAGDAGELKQRMEVKDFGFLEKLGGVPPDARQWFRLDLHSCPTCQMTNTLTVKSVTRSVDKQGKASDTVKDLVDQLLVTSDDAATMRRLGQKFAASAATPAP